MTGTTNLPQRVGARLQRHRLVYGVVAAGLRAVGRARRPGQISRYLGSHELRYLRIGSGSHVDSGWLSTDFVPVRPQVVYMDVTEPFPFPTGSIDAVQCEHVVEHIAYDAALAMLRECHRVLRSGGVLRIATPDLQLVRRLIAADIGDPALRAYVEWSNVTFGTAAERLDSTNPAFTANRLVRNWGHTFIYDEPTLRGALAAAGFHDVTRVKPGHSSHPELEGVDRHAEEVGTEANTLETLALEGIA